MSEILFLGTGGYGWNLGDKSKIIRKNAAVLVNDNLLIDCGEEIFDYRRDSGDAALYDRVTDVLVTHTHDDHFSRDSVLRLAERRKLRVMGNQSVGDALGEHDNIEFIPARPYSEQRLGEYTVIPLLANHTVEDSDAPVLHYIIRTADEKKIYYGLDGGWILAPSWKEMCRHKFDVMVFDCTMGDAECHLIYSFTHNTIPMLREIMKAISFIGLLKDGGSAVATHFTKTAHKEREEMERELGEFHVTAAFDGMRISL